MVVHCLSVYATYYVYYRTLRTTHNRAPAVRYVRTCAYPPTAHAPCATPAHPPPHTHPHTPAHAPARPAACRTAQRGRFWHTHPALPREPSFSYSTPLPGHFRPCHTNPPFCVYRSIRRMFRGGADDAAQDADCAAQDADSSAFPVVVGREWRRRCGRGWGGSGGGSRGTAGRIGRAPVPRSGRPRGIGFGRPPPPVFVGGCWGGKNPARKSGCPPRLPPCPCGWTTPPREGSTPLPHIRRGSGGPPTPLLKNGGGRRKKFDPKTGLGDVNVYIFAGGGE